MPDASEFGVGVADVLENLRKSAKPFKTMLFAFLSGFCHTLTTGRDVPV